MVRTAVVGLALAMLIAPPSVAQVPEARLVAMPAVGAESQAEVGETMVSVAKVETIPSIVTAKTYAKSGLTVPPGVYSLASYNAAGRYYRGDGYLPHRTFGLSQPATTGGIWVPTGSAAPQIYWDGDFGPVRYKVPGITFTVGPAREKASALSFKRELIYSGVSGGVVRISYREFSGDLARPAFTQELTYDLADGDEIGFRGARFRVVKATNTTIHYVVIRPLMGE